MFDKKINFLGEGADKIKTTGRTSCCAIIKFKTIIRGYIRNSCIKWYIEFNRDDDRLTHDFRCYDFLLTSEMFCTNKINDFRWGLPTETYTLLYYTLQIYSTSYNLGYNTIRWTWMWCKSWIDVSHHSLAVMMIILLSLYPRWKSQRGSSFRKWKMRKSIKFRKEKLLGSGRNKEGCGVLYNSTEEKIFVSYLSYLYYILKEWGISLWVIVCLIWIQGKTTKLFHLSLS